MAGTKNKHADRCGAEEFDRWYAALFHGRWPALKAALLEESVPHEWDCGGKNSYFLDTGSICAALVLPVSATGARILDMCAAPGGKTIILASVMAEDAGLTANERSAERRFRLRRNLDGCLPSEIRQRVKISGSDGSRLCLNQQNMYDAVLLDAPCSSERHVLHSPQHLSQWSPSRVKRAAALQWALFSSAFRLLKPGGYLLYATCALSYHENDAVVQRGLRKFADLEIVPAEPAAPDTLARYFTGALPDTERTESGYRVMPDIHNGAGPLYFSLLRKNKPS